MHAPSLQPFFESLGHDPAPRAAAVNADPGLLLERALRVPLDAPGRGIALMAPRAGFGKSHLLETLRRSLAGSHDFLPLRPLDGRHVDAGAAVEDALRCLTRTLPASGGLTHLDLHARHLFASGLEPLVVSGEVPCQDREAAANALRQRPVETFDFHHPQAVTAHWTRENFEVLGPRLSLEISRLSGSSLNQSAFWIASLFQYAIVSPENPGRIGRLFQTAAKGADAERFGTLLAVLSRWRRMVVVADELEGLYGDSEGARKVGGFLGTIRQEAPHADVILSVNRDIWESAFMPALSDGLRDRLSELVVRLAPLGDEEVLALLEARGVAQSRELLGRLALGEGDRFARRVLQRAASLLQREPSAAAPQQVPQASARPGSPAAGEADIPDDAQREEAPRSE
jgi:hypothetical protein